MGRKADAHTRGPVTSTGVAWATTECDPAPPDAANGERPQPRPRPSSPLPATGRGRRPSPAAAPSAGWRGRGCRTLAPALASVPCWHRGSALDGGRPGAPPGRPGALWATHGPGSQPAPLRLLPGTVGPEPEASRGREGRAPRRQRRPAPCVFVGRGQAPAAGRPKDSGRGASEGAETPPRASRGPSARRVPRRGALHLQSSTERRRRRNKHARPLRRDGGASGAGSADSGPCRPAGRTGGERHRRSCGQCPPAGGRRARPASRRGPRGASPALGASLLPRKAPHSLSWAFYSGRFGFCCLRKTPGGLPARGARGGCRPETLGGLLA